MVSSTPRASFRKSRRESAVHSSLHRVTFMAGGRTLVFRVLGATRAYNRLKGEQLPGGLPHQLVSAILQEARIPERFTFFGDQNGIAELKSTTGLSKA